MRKTPAHNTSRGALAKSRVSPPYSARKSRLPCINCGRMVCSCCTNSPEIIRRLLAAIAPEAMVHNAKTNKWQLDYRRIRVLPASSPFGLSTYRALERLACQMSRYSGRKNLFWISAEFPRLFPDGKDTEFAADAMAAARALEAAGVAVFPVDVRSPVPAVPFQPQPPVIGSHKPAVNDRQFVRNMNVIADATGGKTIVNRPELAEAIVDTMRATQRSYELRLRGSSRTVGWQLSRPACPDTAARIDINLQSRLLRPSLSTVLAR